MRKKLHSKKGQAMAEAIIVLPVLIMIIWGIYHAHAVAFLGARAQIAARHAAWVGSVDESDTIALSIGGDTIDREAAEKAGMDILFRNESGMADTIVMGGSRSGKIFNVDPQGLWVPEFFDDDFDGEFLISDFISIGNDIVNAMLSALPIFRPFVQNSYAKVDFAVDSFGFSEPTAITTHAYFANRWDSLYFKSIWDFLNVSLLGVLGDLNDVMSDADGVISDASEQLENFIEDGEFPEGTPYSYEDFMEYLSSWKDLFSSW